MGGKANIVTLNMETCIETHRQAHIHTQTHTNRHTHTQEEKCILIQEALRLYEI